MHVVQIQEQRYVVQHNNFNLLDGQSILYVDNKYCLGATMSLT